MSSLGTFRPVLEKTIAIFEISSFEFAEVKRFMFKKKKLNLGPNLPYLGIFDKNLKNNTIVILDTSTLKFLKKQSFM